MNTELLKSKLLEAAFNGSLTHADTSTWEDAKLGEKITLLSGRDLEPSAYNDLQKGIPYITGASAFNGNSLIITRWTEKPAVISNKGDLLLTCKGTVGLMLFNTIGDLHIARQIMAIRSQVANLTFIRYFITYKIEELQEKAHSLIPGISRDDVLGFEFPCPPLAEQKRIVDALEEGFAYIDAVASAKQNLSDTAELLRNKILQAAFDGSLTGADYSQSIVSLGDVCDIARGGSPRPIKQFITERPDGINWIKIGDTEKGGKYINSCKEKIIPEGVKKSRMVHKGDFLLTNSMSFGRPYITNIDGCIHDGWLVISPHENTFDKDFLYYLLSSSYVFAQFSDKASGSTVSNLNIDKVIATTVPMPPLAEQQRIVAKIEELFEQIDKISK